MTSGLVLRSVGRVLWFAIAGAICMALVGIVVGSATGALVVFIDHLIKPNWVRHAFNYVGIGALFGALRAMNDGFWSGGVAFGIAGYFACFSVLPQKVFAKAFRLAWRAAFAGVVLGAILGTVNHYLFNLFTHAAVNDWLSGYIIGVIGGFIIGTFYGAIVGARHEIARQKIEQNAALSTVESAA